MKFGRFKLLLVVAAVIVGTIYSLAHVIRERELAKQGKPYFAWTQEASFDMFNVHAARYQGLIDGDGLLSYDDTTEHQGGPTLWPLFSVAIFAPFMWLTKSVSETVVITDALFPMLLFGAFFLLFLSLLKNRYTALFSSLVLILFPQLPHLLPPSSLWEFRQIINPLYDLTYLRREAFIPAGVFFILCIHFAHQLLATAGRARRYMMLVGVFYGLLFYFYFYFWAYMTVVLGLLFVAMLVVKQKQTSLYILGAGAIGMLVSIPFWLNQYELMQLPQYQELIERGGLEVGRAFRFGLWKTYVLYAGMAGLALWLGRKLKSQPASLLAASLLIANIVVLNIQLITGFNIQSDHWSGRVFLITVGISWVVILYYTYQCFKSYVYRYKRAIAVLGMVIPVVLAVNMARLQITLEPARAEQHTVAQNLLDAYAWMNDNLPSGSVVASLAFATNTDLPVFTNHKLFMARSQTSIASEQEIIERMLITYKLFGASPQTLAELLATPEGVVYFFTARYEDKALDRYLNPTAYESFAIPYGLWERILSQYQEFILPDGFAYQLDYLFVGPRERELGISEEALAQYPVVYDSGGIRMYRYE